MVQRAASLSLVLFAFQSLSSPLTFAGGSKKPAIPAAAPVVAATPTPKPLNPVHYQIGVQYQFSGWAKEWGKGNWLYSPLQNVGTSVGGFSGKPNQRVPRLYPERQPYVNGQGKWLDIWSTTDVNAEVDMMRAANIDYILYLTEWERNEDPTLPTGFYGFAAELDTFTEVNKHRKPGQQVKFALELTSNHITVGYKSREDFIAIFRAKIKYALDHAKLKDDAGNSLYYMIDGKPVISWWEGAKFITEAIENKTTAAELIGISQQMAKDAGFPGIYWVDSANTIIDRNLKNAHDGNYVIDDFKTYQDMIAEAGFNAETGFVYHGISGVYGIWMTYEGYKQAIQAYSAIWAGMIEGAKKHPNFKYFPPVTPGWDSRAIGEAEQPNKHDQSRSCDGAFDNHNSDPLPWGCSPDGGLFIDMLKNAKVVIDQNQDTTNQTLIIGTWNDVLEGHYLIPTVGDKGAHAKAVSDVFVSTAATADAQTTATPPAPQTMTQKLMSMVDKTTSYISSLFKSDTEVTATPTPTPAAQVTSLDTNPITNPDAQAIVTAITPTPTTPPVKAVATPKKTTDSSSSECESKFSAMLSRSSQWEVDARAGKCATLTKEMNQADPATECSSIAFTSLSPALQGQVDDTLDSAVNTAAKAGELYQTVRNQNKKAAQEVCDESAPLIAEPVPTIAPLKSAVKPAPKVNIQLNKRSIRAN